MMKGMEKRIMRDMMNNINLKRLTFVFLFLTVCVSIAYAEDANADNAKSWLDSLQDGNSGVLLKSIGSNFDSDVVSAFFQSYLGTFMEPAGCATAGPTSMKDILIPTASIIILILFAVAVMYMLGQALQSQNLVALAKDELHQIIQTAVIIIFLTGMIFGADEWLKVKANPLDGIYKNSPTMIDAAMQYSRFIAYQITSEISQLLVFNTFVQTLYTATVYIGVNLKAMFSFSVGPLLKPIVDVLSMVLQFLSTALGEWILHYALLCFVKRWTWEIFIPLGVLLRAIPQTRGAGDALIAIFFSFSLIYPMMIVANWEIYKLTSFVVIPAESLVSTFFQSTGIFGVGLFGMSMLLSLGSVIMPVIMGAMIGIVFELVKTAVYYIVIVSILMPFINIFITLTAARETSRAFGSEINFGSFVKLI